jgi:crossover junction endodeoxyribonuclease RuvC
VIALGIDSSTKCGLVVLEKSARGRPVLVLHAAEYSSPSTGLQRCSDIAEAMLALLDRYKPDTVVIEGLGFANAHTLVTLAEIHTILRYFLWQTGYGFVPVAPNALKKFVLGVGKGDKAQIVKGVYKRWGFDADTDNIADAYVAAMVGLALDGLLDDMIKAQEEVIEKLKLEVPLAA